MIEQILVFVQNNSQWAAVIVFIVAFLESMAVIGLFIPGWMLLVGVGTLIGADLLSFYPIAIAAYAGAVIGEYLSFLLGYFYHEKVLAWPFISKHEKLITKSRDFFKKHGIAGVFIGRFFGPTRALVPLIAGIAEMKRRHFIWVNLVSGLIWAPLYLIPGILIGAAAALEGNEGKELLLIFVVLALTMSVCWNYGVKFYQGWQAKTWQAFDLVKAALPIAIFLTSMGIVLKSSYWPLIEQIFTVLISKL